MKRTVLSFCLFLLGSVALLRAQQWNGLTYYSNMGSSSGYLIDTNSVNVKTYTFSGGTGYSTHYMPGGNFVRSVQIPGNPLTGGGMHGRLQKLDYNGNLLWDWSYSSSTYCLHHDHCIMPNGNILVICYDVRNQTDISNAGCSYTGTTLWSEKIMEIQPVGSNSMNIVWEWKLWDHTVQNVNPALPNYYANIVDHPELLNVNYQIKKDWIHMNGIDYNPILDQIVVSSHNLNEWYVIDHSTTQAEAASHSGGNAGKGGDFLYRWGNPAAYQAGGTAVLNVTHDSHWVPEGCPDAGKMSGINNKGVTSPSNKTCADMITPPRQSYNYTVTPGQAYTPAAYEYRHQSTGYTSNMGSVEEFPNGNRMICLATVGTIYEIDAAGNTLWSKSTLGSTPQSHRYTTCYLNNAAPPQPSISVNGNNLIATSAASYQWYLNGDLISGANSQTYIASQNGIYVVRTTDANGCVYVYSAGKQYGIPSALRSFAGSDRDPLIYPNPAYGRISIRMAEEVLKVEVRDIKGMLVHTTHNEKELDLQHLSEGIYFLTVTGEGIPAFTSRICLMR